MSPDTTHPDTTLPDTALLPGSSVADATVADPTVADATVADAGHRVGRPRDDAREQAILDATIAVLAEVGYDRLTVEAVATSARASKATIYRRWPGKAELVVAALKRRVPVAEAPPDTGSLRGDLLGVATMTCVHIDGLDGQLLCGLAGAARSDPELAAAVRQETNEAKAPWIAGILARAADRGELATAIDPALVFEIVPAISLMRALQGETLDPGFAVHLVDDIVLPVLRQAAVTAAGAPTPDPDLPPTPDAPPTKEQHP